MSVLSNTQLKNRIDSTITDNNNREIEGLDHNALLKDFVDSFFNQISNASGVGLRDYDSSKSYGPGETVIYNNGIWRATGSTTGTFDETKWEFVMGMPIRFIDSSDSPYTIAEDDRFIVYDGSTGNGSVELPDATVETNKEIVIIKVDSSNTLTINTNGAQTVNGASSESLSTDTATARLISDGTNWISVGPINMPLNIGDLLVTEVEQLKNINSNTISNTQWSYLGGLDQFVSTFSDVTFVEVQQDARVESWLDSDFTSNQNDWNHTGNSFHRINNNGAYNLTGAVGDVKDGFILKIYNQGTNDLTITHEDVSSSASNRFYINGSSNDAVLAQRGTAQFVYDANMSRWVLQFVNQDVTFI